MPSESRTTIRQVRPGEDPHDVLSDAIFSLSFVWGMSRPVVSVDARFSPIASVTTPDGDVLWAADPDEMVGAWAVTVTYREGEHDAA